MQVGLLRIGRGQGEIHLAGAHQIKGRPRQHIMDLERDAGMGFAIGHEHARQKARRQRRQGRHGHLPLVGAHDAAHGVDGLAEGGLQVGGLLQKDLSGRRQAHTARAAIEQPHAQGFFDAQHLGRQGRLRQMQLGGRLAEIERAAQHQHGIDVAHRQIDVHAAPH